MNIENFENRAKTLEYRGIGTGHHEELKDKMETGVDAFSLEGEVPVKGDVLKYECLFNKDKEHDFYYFDRINVILVEKNGQETAASIKTDWKVSLTEAYNLLKFGEKVAVFKEGLKNAEGNTYSTYINFQKDGPVDEYGHVPFNTYHENYYLKYPFDIREKLQNMPIPIKELVPQNIDRIIKSMQKAEPLKVTMMLHGQEVSGYLTINARKGRIDMMDANMELIELSQKEQVKVETKEEPSPADEKKKSWENRKPEVKWSRKPGSGMSV